MFHRVVWLILLILVYLFFAWKIFMVSGGVPKGYAPVAAAAILAVNIGDWLFNADFFFGDPPQLARCGSSALIP